MLRARILIAEDEPDFASALAEFLQDLGYQTEIVATGIALDAALRAGPRDLILLDLGLPGRTGFDLLDDSDLIGRAAVIVLTGNPDAVERIVGLEAGADDYLVKPVDLRELAARIGSVLARRLGRQRQIVSFENASADLTAARILYPDGLTAPLSPGEVALIRTFAENPHRVLDRDQLLELAPAETTEALDRAIDSRIARLRRKLGTAQIVTLRGRGFRYEPD
ncbi:response regulator transcription factor [Paracoccus sp. CPCC 101403]|uniref:Response regulator transcription factor n=1 Tax=Paracoccus broussonetiae TaxID=3075834 RepID=A0ABU3EDN8_9RHOB|nr:response regulator transcription factor [Paracoccus sp. CPCC 101403]MDT1062353.1 response regulator transcription factor [Paracoccus sp. CPCC 101403]